MRVCLWPGMVLAFAGVPVVYFLWQRNPWPQFSILLSHLVGWLQHALPRTPYPEFQLECNTTVRVLSWVEYLKDITSVLFNLYWLLVVSGHSSRTGHLLSCNVLYKNGHIHINDAAFERKALKVDSVSPCLRLPAHCIQELKPVQLKPLLPEARLTGRQARQTRFSCSVQGVATDAC